MERVDAVVNLELVLVVESIAIHHIVNVKEVRMVVTIMAGFDNEKDG